MLDKKQQINYRLYIAEWRNGRREKTKSKNGQKQPPAVLRKQHGFHAGSSPVSAKFTPINNSLSCKPLFLIFDRL